MLSEQALSWIVSVVGMSGFILAGRRVWWCWYVNISCQVFWAMYAIVSETPAFFFTALFYFVIFTINAIKWTRENFALKSELKSGRYKPKSIVVDARYFDGGVESAEEIIAWLTDLGIQSWWKEPASSYVNNDGRFIKEMPETIRILHEEGTLDLCPNEYIVKGTDGHLYISGACAFESTYERVV